MKVSVRFGPPFDRIPHPDASLEESIGEVVCQSNPVSLLRVKGHSSSLFVLQIWNQRLQQNPSLYNGTKFRVCITSTCILASHLSALVMHAYTWFGQRWMHTWLYSDKQFILDANNVSSILSNLEVCSMPNWYRQESCAMWWSVSWWLKQFILNANNVSSMLSNLGVRSMPNWYWQETCAMWWSVHVAYNFLEHRCIGVC